MSDQTNEKQRELTQSSNLKQDVNTELGINVAGSRSQSAQQEDTSSSGSSDSESEYEELKTSINVPSTDINQRLTSFFSQLAQRRDNPVEDEIIEEDSSDSGFEDENSGKQYIQLDLALGVLSQQDESQDEVVLPHLSESDTGGDENDSQANIEKLKSVKTAESAKKKKKKDRGKQKIEELG